jgi:hypothetical protein
MLLWPPSVLEGPSTHEALCTKLSMPATMQVFTDKGFVGDIEALGWRIDTGQKRYGCVSHHKEGLGQRMIIATGRVKSIAGNHARWLKRGEQMKALIPAYTVTPADVGLPCQPAGAHRLASCVGRPELSSTSYSKLGACIC